MHNLLKVALVLATPVVLFTLSYESFLQVLFVVSLSFILLIARDAHRDVRGGR